MKLKLEGKVALVTGAARGIGAATCMGLAEEGVNIAALDIGWNTESEFGTREQLEEIVSKIKKLGCETITIYADLTKEEQVKSAVDQTVKNFGKLDILINCVGFIRFGLVQDMPYDDWKIVFLINTRAHFLACKYAVPIIEQGWGRIINISSNLGLRGMTAKNSWFIRGVPNERKNESCIIKSSRRLWTKQYRQTWLPWKRVVNKSFILRFMWVRFKNT